MSAHGSRTVQHTPFQQNLRINSVFFGPAENHKVKRTLKIAFMTNFVSDPFQNPERLCITPGLCPSSVRVFHVRRKVQECCVFIERPEIRWDDAGSHGECRTRK